MRPATVVMLQYAVPALVLIAIWLAGESVRLEEALLLAVNYPILASLHLAVGVVSLIKRAPLHAVNGCLATLNCALILFALWVVTQVPVSEGGLAWLLYFPFAAFALALHFIARRLWRRPGQAPGTVR